MICTVMTSHYAAIKPENSLSHTSFLHFCILLLKTSCCSGKFFFLLNKVVFPSFNRKRSTIINASFEHAFYPRGKVGGFVQEVC